MNAWSPYRILITGGSGSGKTIALLNLIKQQKVDYDIIDRIYLYVKDPSEEKYQYLVIDDYSWMIFEAKYKIIHEEGVWTPKQLLQRLPTASA